MKRYPITKEDERPTRKIAEREWYPRETYSEGAMRSLLIHGLKELELRTRDFISGRLVSFPAALLPQVRMLIKAAERMDAD